MRKEYNWKEYRKRYYLKNKEKILERNKEYHKTYYLNNKEKIIKKSSDRMINLYNSDPYFRLVSSYRRKLKRILIFPTRKKHNRYLDVRNFISCTRSDLREQFERSFPDGCNWDNYGIIWEIDHIIPISNFDLNKDEDVKKCFHYSNLRPILKSENRKKNKF